MNTYQIEVTDTFGGEANYCWVRRYTVRAKSIRGAIQTLAKEYAKGWKLEYSDSLHARYNLKGCAICCFIDYVESDS